MQITNKVAQINGTKCLYIPTSYYIESDKIAYHKINLTPKEHFARWMGLCKDGLSWGFAEAKQFDKIINRVMKSINDNGNIINDLWLKRIAKNQNDLYQFDRLFGLFNDGRNSSDTDFFTESELFELTKKAVKRATKPFQTNAKEVKKLIKLYK